MNTNRQPAHSPFHSRTVSPGRDHISRPTFERRCPRAWLALPGLLAGHHRDFTSDELKQRYSSHAAYVKQVWAVMQQTMAQSHVLPQDARVAMRAAEQANVAR